MLKYLQLIATPTLSRLPKLKTHTLWH
uniref:Uncharacterized protein n=1 Tax=Dactylellina haptotyla TaxID=430498 RepID=B2BK83_9PEZI|nr:hypothetical protein [Dactylellina haptotyla]